MEFTLFCVGAFLAGSIPTAYLAGRIKGIDIRRHGSGNVGATNVFRVMGKGPGSAVFLLDFLKGALPVYLYGASAVLAADGSGPLWVGLCAILGHVFTPFLGFKGGKGIATGAGVLLGWWPPFFFIGIGIWLAVFYLTKIVSVSSMAAASALFLAAFFWGQTADVTAFFLLAAVFVFWTHRANIGRLLKGEEKEISSKKS